MAPKAQPTIATNKAVYYAIPGVPVQIEFTGTSADQAKFTPDYIQDTLKYIVTKPDGVEVTTNTTNKTITINKEGDVTFTLKNLVESDETVVSFEIKCKNIITVDQTEITLHDRETKDLLVTTDVLDVRTTISPEGICSYSDGVITPIKPGSAVLGFQVTDNEKELTQSVSVNVTVRPYVEATRFEIVGARPFQVQGGKTLQIKVNKGETDTLSVETTEGQGQVDDDIVSYTPERTEISTTKTITIKATSTDGDVYSEEVEVIVLPIDNVKLLVKEPISVVEGETLNLVLDTNATAVTLEPSVDNFTVNATDRSITGVRYGVGQLTLRGTADGYLPTEKVVNVTIKPAPLSRPTLKTKVLTMMSGSDIYLEFILDKKGTLVVVENTQHTTLEVNKNIVKWTAPDIGVLPSKVFEFEAYVERKETNTVSEKYQFSITVNKTQHKEEGEEFDLSDIAAVLKDDVITFEEKIRLIKENAPEEIVDTIADLEDYIDTMSVRNSYKLSEDKGAEKQYKLFLIIRGIIETEDNDYFQVMFDLLNLYFREHKKDVFDEVQLSRFDTSWTYGAKALLSFQLITICISILCDLKTRSKNLTLVDFNTIFDPAKTVWKEENSQSVITYYTA